MDLLLLIKLMGGLVAILAVLVFFLILAPKEEEKVNKTKKIKTHQEYKQKTDLYSLVEIIKDRKTTSAKLKETLDLILKHHGKIHKKLGIRVHPDFYIYVNILVTICRHPNTDKHIILNFDKELTRLNPQYKANISSAIEKGLKSRGL